MRTARQVSDFHGKLNRAGGIPLLDFRTADTSQFVLSVLAPTKAYPYEHAPLCRAGAAERGADLQVTSPADLLLFLKFLQFLTDSSSFPLLITCESFCSAQSLITTCSCSLI